MFKVFKKFLMIVSVVIFMTATQDVTAQDEQINPPDWQQPVGKQNIFTITAAVMLNGEFLGSNPNSMLSTWDGEQITGVIESYINPCTGYPTFALVATSNKSSISGMSFKIYDADTDEIYEIEETVTFTASGEIGNFFVPFIINAIAPDGLGITGDFNSDGIVDDADLVIFCTQWMAEGTLEADIYPLEQGDGRVDLKDFAVFANVWLTAENL